MKIRPEARPAVLSAAYLLLHLGSECLARRFPSGPGVGLREAPGFAFAFLVLCQPRLALVVVAAQLISFLAINSSNPGVALSIAYSFVAAGGYAGMAWLVGKRLGPAPIPKRRSEGMFLLAASVGAALPAVVVEALAPTRVPGRFRISLWAEVAFRWAGAVGEHPCDRSGRGHIRRALDFSRTEASRHAGPSGRLDGRGRRRPRRCWRRCTRSSSGRRCAG